VGKRTLTGGRWEGLFLEADTIGLWKVLGRTRGKIQAGESVQLTDREGRPGPKLTLITQESDSSWIVHTSVEGDPYQILEQVGRTPLPPYIRGGEMLPEDAIRYQTVYAQHPGSVAAPTAGLHFTELLLDQLAAAKIQRAEVTLHVGTGTFRPIASETLSEHAMHSEWAQVSATTAQTLAAVRGAAHRVVAVGTTSMRVLETAAAGGPLGAFEGSTDLFIRPPYPFQVVDALLTNFHLPRTTLLVLVRTFGGDALIRRAYQLAVEEEYRFYSYGDAMLIL
jgi:S-adenosylmethionine:tRNA ribosyltransferase-isomerase